MLDVKVLDALIDYDEAFGFRNSQTDNIYPSAESYGGNKRIGSARNLRTLDRDQISYSKVGKFKKQKSNSPSENYSSIQATDLYKTIRYLNDLNK